MPSETLEIRGISKKDICIYLTQIGGSKGTDSTFIGPTWTATVTKAETYRFLQSDIPKVYVSFKSDDGRQLKTIIDAFRKKTSRIGG